MTNEQIAWSSKISYDADVCLSVERHDGPIEVACIRSYYSAKPKK